MRSESSIIDKEAEKTLGGGTLQAEVAGMARAAKAALPALLRLSPEEKATVLHDTGKILLERKASILAANQADVEAAKAEGLSGALIDRLLLTEKRLSDIARGCAEVATLSDPVFSVIEERTRPNGLRIRKVRVPIGVIAVIYESRPNVTIEAASLCFKSGNAVILRGGSEAIRSNTELIAAFQSALKSNAAPIECAQLISTPERDAVKILVQLDGLVDLAIPRGGEGLIRAVAAAAKVPIIKHFKGVCHVFVDESADLSQAVAIVENAKCQRPGVCNAIETLLVHQTVAPKFLPIVGKRLEERGVELRGDEEARRYLSDAKPATEEDWYAEYLDLILAVRVVPDVDAAIAHIERYGSRHSDSILTSDKQCEAKFLREVDSAVVYSNASTRFTDGGEFGMGAEIGISTERFHARGPMGLEELTTYKYLVLGSGHVRG